MKKEQIHFPDWHRLLMGTEPWPFAIEVLIRTLAIVLFLFLAVRIMNNRMASQVTITELAVMVTLGAIVSPIMQLPDRGVLFGIVGLGFGVAFQRAIGWLGVKHKSYEKAFQGTVSTLVENGHLNLAEMKKVRVSRQEIYSVLREHNVKNLGEVERLYLEACGLFSVYLATKPDIAGLRITPQEDPEARDWMQDIDHGQRACMACGHVQLAPDNNSICEVCGAHDWVGAAGLTAAGINAN